MEKKNLCETSGRPFNFGIASGVILLLATILTLSLTQPYTESLLSGQGLSSTFGSVGLISGVVGFIINPGIFLILLFRGLKKPARGTAYCVVWIVIGGLSVVSDLYSMLVTSSRPNPAPLQNVPTIQQFAETLIPGGMVIPYILSILGSALMVTACILLLLRLRSQLPRGTEVEIK